jgi:flavin-binding protein dodecin
MTDHVCRKVELVGSSQRSIAQAIGNALARAGESARHIGWFEVKDEIRGHAADGAVGTFQVTLQVGSRPEEDE